MKKKILSAVCALAMVFGSAAALPEGFDRLNSAITASAETFGDYEYTVSDDGTVEVSGYKGNASELTIPSTIDGKKVTTIGDNAFGGSESLTSVTIPDSVTRIGFGAFYGCSSLTSITIPNSVTLIGGSAFAVCTSLQSITLPNSITSISPFTFSDCTSLTNVTLPDSVISISQSAFERCTGLESITIPNSVTSIGNQVFFGSTKLKSITIPDSVTSIGVQAFYDCTNLTSITIPDSVTSIGFQAFKNSKWLEAQREIDPIVVVNNILIDGQGCEGDVTVPDNVTSIVYRAFDNCSGITSITIPESVTSIGKEAFGYYWNSDLGDYLKIDDLTIYGYKNSAAETYANDNGFKFVASDEEAVTLLLTLKAPEGSALAAETVTVTIGGDTVETAAGEITLPDLADGKYAMTVSADNYVPRTYSVTVASGMIVEDIETELHLIGDITGDGKLNAADLLKAKSHIKGVSPIEGYEFDCANVDGNKALNAADLLKMKAHMKGVTPLWT